MWQVTPYFSGFSSSSASSHTVSASLFIALCIGEFNAAPNSNVAFLASECKIALTTSSLVGLFSGLKER